ncbi:HAMP domain-containing sensor histidine kinase [Polaromonas sp.]|uniref:sensor histidine kinase n=1 Tax=Polaromonas sp. TaxID=1869339 RepID=UPI00286A57F0|nr:HAMP domain-containing sensor histidine kinase [Polaromonas sp.]
MKARSRQPTLTLRLLLLVLGSLVGVWLSFVTIAFQVSQSESEELTDGQLASVVALLLNEKHPDYGNGGAADRGIGLLKSRYHDYQQSLTVVAWDSAGRRITSIGDAPVPDFDGKSGFADLHIGTPTADTHWRSFSQWDDGHTRKVMAMLNMSDRDRVADEFAQEMILPGLAVLPVVALALWLAIRRGLRPLYQLSDDVARLDVGRSERLPERQALREFDSVTMSINSLIVSQAATLARERQLASEVAHELRTPLSSITLHAKSLRSELPAQEREQALIQIETDALRAGHVLTQLLALARASRAELDAAAVQVDLATLARHVVSEYAQAAWSSGHELALGGVQGLWLRGHPVLIELGLRNLVENALRHTPPGTVVEVQTGSEGHEVWLQVCDSGGPPGSARQPERRVKPHDALGLGHKIVERVAEVHGGRFECLPPAGDAPVWASRYRLTFKGTVDTDPR